MESTQFQSVPFIKSDESVLVIEYDKFNLYEYDFLREEIEPTRFVRTIDSCDMLKLQLATKNVRLLMVHFNAKPIEGCYIIQLFRVLRKKTPVVVLFDEYDNWRAEAEQAGEFGFSAGLLNPISAEKWYRLCDHLARDNNEFVVIE
jgi:hypothetical protein